MAHDSEKRFHRIMDKLFTPPSKSPLPSSSSTSSPGEHQSRGRKRPNPSSALSLVEPKTVLDQTNKSSSHSSLCRPWDRGDLMNRLSTFKSMTWFAKPQVISAVNCARRGWINVDTDTIACESCGAHLLFSTPSSWPTQQVEKAASVFSLKLESGHRQLCPWIDNSCEETLVEFPQMTPQDLSDRFEERLNALSQLPALPMISQSTIEFMKSPELEEFLKHPISSSSSSASMASGSSSAQLFYQAQKLISICGWEPRTLPYIVDSNETSNNHKNEYVESDSSSIVLDCKLCGACVGLWVFSTLPRPLEFYRVTGSTEVNPDNHPNNDDNNNNVVSEQNSSLKFTIAGGPPATKQNFKATISFPVIGRNLRSRMTGGEVTGHEDCGKDDRRRGNLIFLDDNNDPKDSISGESKRGMEFDAIRQHRHFCPWITESGLRGCGWKLTLSALQPRNPSSPSSVYKMDDPLTSVRNLFKSPSSSKKLKPNPLDSSF